MKKQTFELTDDQISVTHNFQSTTAHHTTDADGDSGDADADGDGGGDADSGDADGGDA